VRLLLLLALLTLTACASPADSGAGDSTSDPGAGGDITQADDDLQVHVDPGDGTEPQTWTLSCLGAVTGSHPDPEAACAHLKTMDDPFAPIPDDVACTEQFGGPQTSHVIGRWAGEEVDLQLSRVDGCRISQWDSLVPLVPAVVGVEPGG
jgi:Subtilisin inhibitor-like